MTARRRSVGVAIDDSKIVAGLTDHAVRVLDGLHVRSVGDTAVVSTTCEPKTGVPAAVREHG
jgi:hypothetical protein